MKILKAVVMTIALVLMLTAPSHAAITNLILNGSFESPDVAPGAYGPIGGWMTYLGTTSGLVWTPLPSGGMAIQDHVVGANYEAWNAYDGDQLAELDTEPPYFNGGMEQKVNTISGQEYNLSFALSPRPGVGTSSSGIQLYWNDGLVDTLLTDGSGLTNTSWAIRNYTFTATGSEST